jgi:hypothetical protein
MTKVVPCEMNLVATLTVFVVIYLQGFRIEIPVKKNRFRRQRGSYPVASGLSTVSARSGNTVFYDAQSWEGVALTPPPVPPLPQGTTSTGRSGPAPAPAASSPIGEPIRAPDDSELPPSNEPTALGSSKKDELGDILDAPVPPSRVAVCISIIRKGIVSTARPGPLTSSDHTKYAWQYRYRPFGRGTPCCGREAVDSGHTKPARATNDLWLGKFVKNCLYTLKPYFCIFVPLANVLCPPA